MKFCDERILKHLLNGGKIKKSTHNYPLFLDSVGALCFNNNINITYYYTIAKKDLTDDDWKIVESEYDWDKIMKDKILCQFWNEVKYTDEPYVGYLTKKTAKGFYRNECYSAWKYCRPFNPAEYKIAKNIKDYEK